MDLRSIISNQKAINNPVKIDNSLVKAQKLIKYGLRKTKSRLNKNYRSVNPILNKNYRSAKSRLSKNWNIY
jgi:hypothetical protein